ERHRPAQDELAAGRGAHDVAGRDHGGADPGKGPDDLTGRRRLDAFGARRDVEVLVHAHGTQAFPASVNGSSSLLHRPRATAQDARQAAMVEALHEVVASTT